MGIDHVLLGIKEGDLFIPESGNVWGEGNVALVLG